MNVKSVYNFVPAPRESEVFKPDWADKVSHDIPFEDGESGEIELTLTAKTPIFIRNGHSKMDAELFQKQQKGDLPNPTDKEKASLDKYSSFSNVVRNGTKEYFIPGSSLKGMFRNVLEIMSFSRLKTANDIFGYRDMASRKSEFKNEVALNRNPKTGWLEKVNDSWVIKECEVGRISILDIEKRFDVSFNDLSASEKYAAVNQQILNLRFTENRELGLDIRGNFIKTGTLYDFSNNGDFKGDLVFFGSMNNKKYEYIFTKPINGKEYDVDTKLIKKYKDIDKKLDKTQWQYLISNNNPYPNGIIPIFFKEKDGKVEHFGFSRLYKMSNTKYLNELNPLVSYYARDKQYAFDLADTIFGTVEDTDIEHGENRNKKSLKGRVFIGHAFGVGEIVPNSPVDLVLGGPKASYYPFYIKDGKTYLNEDSELKGYKKYPVHNDNSTEPSQLNADNTDIQSTITPLPANTVFKSKVRFFDLNKVEIGALLSAITFHMQNDILNHSLGSAKPLGFGKVNIVANLNSTIGKKNNNYIAEYEDAIATDLKKKGINWIKSDALKELYAVSKDPLREMLLRYPELELKGKPAREANEFNNFRQEGLKAYSENLKESFSSVSDKKRKELEFRQAEKIEEERIAKEKAEQERVEAEKKVKFEAERKIEVERLAKEKKEREERERLLKDEEEKILAAQEKNKIKAKEEKEKLTEEGIVNIILNLSDYEEAKSVIADYLNKVGSISKEEYPLIKGLIERCYNSSSSKKHIKKWSKFNKNPWKFIADNWVDKQTAQNWHNEITNK